MAKKEEDRILTLHPQGKKGVNILRSKYETIKNVMLQIIKKEGEIAYQDLSDRMEKDLQDSFDGRVGWYVVSVKLDLEARRVIERIPKTSPHQVRLCK